MVVPTQGYIYIDNQQITFNVLQNFEDNGFSVDNDGYALYNGKRFYYNGTLVLGTDEPIDTEHYWTIIDLTGYTWVANSELDLNQTGGYTFNFISNNNSYSLMTIQYLPFPQQHFELLYSDDIVYYNDMQSGNWSNEAYKTIQITGGTDATNADLIAWLEANGTLTAPQPSPSQTNNIFFGNSTIDKIYFGTSEVSKIYYGNTLIYEGGGSDR